MGLVIRGDDAWIKYRASLFLYDEGYPNDVMIFSHKPHVIRFPCEASRS